MGQQNNNSPYSSSIHDRIDRAEKQIRQYQSEISDYDETISRLEKADDGVRGVGNEVDSFIWHIRNYDVGVAWQGNLREEWESQKREAVKSAESYNDQIDDIGFIIRSKLRELRSQRGQIQRKLDQADYDLKAVTRGGHRS